MVRQSADRGELGRLLAPRGLRGIYAAALRALARGRGALCGDDGRPAQQDRQRQGDRPRPRADRGGGIRALKGRRGDGHLL